LSKRARDTKTCERDGSNQADKRIEGEAINEDHGRNFQRSDRTPQSQLSCGAIQGQLQCIRSSGRMCPFFLQRHGARQRKGIATEAVSLDYCFGELGLHRVQAFIHPDNTASRKLVQKLGFRCEGLLYGATTCSSRDWKLTGAAKLDFAAVRDRRPEGIDEAAMTASGSTANFFADAITVCYLRHCRPDFLDASVQSSCRSTDSVSWLALSNTSRTKAVLQQLFNCAD
jgi:Acetyltransferase (GNAT) domain